MRGLAALSEICAGVGICDDKGTADDDATAAALDAMMAPNIGTEGLAACDDVSGAGPLYDLSDALSRGAFDGDDGETAEPSAQELEAKDERGDPIDAHAAAIATLAAEASREALNAPKTDADDTLATHTNEPVRLSVAKKFVVATRHLSRAAVHVRVFQPRHPWSFASIIRAVRSVLDGRRTGAR